MVNNNTYSDLQLFAKNCAKYIDVDERKTNQNEPFYYHINYVINAKTTISLIKMCLFNLSK